MPTRTYFSMRFMWPNCWSKKSRSAINRTKIVHSGCNEYRPRERAHSHCLRCFRVTTRWAPRVNHRSLHREERCHAIFSFQLTMTQRKCVARWRSSTHSIASIRKKIPLRLDVASSTSLVVVIIELLRFVGARKNVLPPCIIEFRAGAADPHR